MAFLSGYTSRWEYKVAASKVPSTQTNFPVYVDLSAMPASFWSTVSASGGDIRVTRSDGTTECAREVVSCDTATDTGELHFLANSVDSTTDTVFYIYANGTSSDYAVTATYGRNAVWGDYEMVQHANDATTSSIIDSTGNGNTGNKAVNNPDQINGQLGQAQDWDASGEGINFGSGSTIDDIFAGGGTVQFWVYSNSSRYANSSSASFAAIFDKNGNAIYATTAYGSAAYLIQRTTGTQGNWSVPIASALPTGSWAQNTIIYNSSTVATSPTWYVNGATLTVTAQTSTSGSATSDASNNLEWGNRIDDARAYNGAFDEIRYRSGALSANWITTEYNNQSDHSTFATIGAEETDGGGGATFTNFKGFGGL